MSFLNRHGSVNEETLTIDESESPLVSRMFMKIGDFFVLVLVVCC